ncbi:group II intron reverse transcriptase/maturase [Microaceticoccus formicicus]|uniref:group II intron reverse transcriptase/maturase n=1 Tax=Microaceticoccus formicicus TaxID=3118105 RepID=UPI003CD0477B|nr:group II intron reverse transcriptase/maturase [Peptoniphilaceae bacterium AMB_02]
MERKLIDEILDRKNMYAALKQVVSNKGTCGIDGITVLEIEAYIRENWKEIEKSIRERTYKPQPVLRVEIPKPNGGVRKLGIPTVMDRIIQQAIVQVISPICEKEFSEYSYGFRPGRSTQMAIEQILYYLNEGYEWIVDIDLEKFFDEVPQDKLMSYLHNIIKDPDTESLIRKYLKAGVMNKGQYEETKKGTPQGGNLSPLLSNIMLNQLDKELEKRELRFTRYADDCVILVKSENSAKRVMRSITNWIEKKLSLKVNATKSKMTKPINLKYLGFGFWKDKQTQRWKARPHQDSIRKFKDTIKTLTKRRWSVDFSLRLSKLNDVIRGWVNYFKIGSMKSAMNEISERLRTRLRMIIWKMWKVPSKRQWGLQKLGIGKDLARLTSYVGDRYYFVCTKTCVVRAITKELLIRRGLVDPYDYYMRNC